MLAFAANSILCRVALRGGHIDAAGFTLLRLASGALVLATLARLRGLSCWTDGSWPSALALVAYAVGFSLAYLFVPAGTGALLLFGAVQSTMIGYGLWRGERLNLLQWLGLAVAFAGIVGLLLPGLSAPPIEGAALMIAAGVAWGIYSLRGRSSASPLGATAGNFIRALAASLPLGAVALPRLAMDAHGAAYAIASGALASGLGYAIWYRALPGLRASSAASVQLSVPVIAAVGGGLLLGEDITARMLAASAAILTGIAVVIRGRRTAA